MKPIKLLVPLAQLNPLESFLPVPRESAIKEYIAIVAYLIYHASTIIDVRNVS